MNRDFKRKWIRAVAAVVAALAATWATGAVWDTYKVMKMTGEMKTVCVGRILIDLPKEAQVELYGQWIEGFDIDAFAESEEAFTKRVAAREAEIRAKPDRLGGNKNMEAVSEVKTESGLAGKIFVHSRNVSEGTESDGLTIERYHYEGVALEAHVHGNGVSIDLTAKDYDPDLAANLPRLVSQLVPNPANRIPTDPGFCLDRAYVREPLTAKQGERITMAVGLPGHPDIGINVDTIAGTRPDPRTLLERNAVSRARRPAALNLLATELRAAPRTIAGFAGDELVRQVIESNGVFVYGFEWELNGTEDNVLVPDIRLAMVTGRGDGGPAPSSLSAPAAMALWDRIASSLRVRPAARPH
ncbi:T6SS immunity protein Tli4 family protein [Massilia sp. Root335]|uniref:T6SS immunity protein Tli4 family protein n=1 Tax=Massilia sp. Root335 TaxID=1736517 RepID=UPI0006FCEA01|nr:T6SS immunity protein Tli4 family protein [Massilia sp. Root335]KQV51981.1 hypothetical protein ASC93_04855 [Massilia sp. Root335]